MSETLYTSQTPGIANIFENQNVTVGETRIFGAAGTVGAARFFASTTVGGTYEAALWLITADDSPAVSGTGTLLGTATFGTLTPGAWNLVSFSSPISVAANTAYRISVRTSQGRYAATSAFYNSAGVTNGNVSAQQTGANPTGIGALDNGSFIESLTTYPNKTFNGNAYFVDVVFDAASSAVTGDAALAVTATLSTAAATTKPAAAALTATATLAAGAAASKPAAAALTVTATLAAAVARTALPTASLTVTAALSTSAVSSKPAAAALAATATLTSDASTGAAPVAAAAALSATATLTVAPVRSTQAGAALAVTATLASGAGRTAATDVALAVTATLAAGPVSTRAVGAALAAVATLIASATSGGRITYRPSIGTTIRPLAGTTTRP